MHVTLKTKYLAAAVLQPKSIYKNQSPIENVMCVVMPWRESDDAFSSWVQPTALKDKKLAA